MSMTVTLEPIDTTNWIDCCRLHVADDQRAFVVINNAYAMAACYADPRQTSLAVRAGDDLVGFLHFEVHGDQAELHTIMIAQEHQGHGFGRAAMRALIDRLRSEGIARLRLDLLPENAAAHRLYASLGFSEISSARPETISMMLAM